jgi:endonuclease/exonuclease/phosphatase family metal-dependent hydrolase
MKLISLNVSIKIDNAQKVAEYLKSESPDIITLQEVMRPLSPAVFPMYRSKEAIDTALQLSHPQSFFGPLVVTEAIKKNGEIHRDFGGIIEQGNELLSAFPIVYAANEYYYKTYEYFTDWMSFETEDHPRAVQIVELDINGKRLQVLNLHGIWTKDKEGDERTLKECEYILSVAKRKSIPTIIVGDFNLLPHTKSILLMEKDFRNLIKEYNITHTRPDFADGFEKGMNVVDYVFVSKDIQVNGFKVVDTDLSDHLPLVLDFDLR